MCRSLSIFQCVNYKGKLTKKLGMERRGRLAIMDMNGYVKYIPNRGRVIQLVEKKKRVGEWATRQRDRCQSGLIDSVGVVDAGRSTTKSRATWFDWSSVSTSAGSCHDLFQSALPQAKDS